MTNKENRKIQEKRTTYIRELIQSYSDTSSDRTIEGCFDYVNDEFQDEEFLNTLTDEERSIVEPNIKNWTRLSLESLNTFRIFLKNNDIVIEKK